MPALASPPVSEGASGTMTGAHSSEDVWRSGIVKQPGVVPRDGLDEGLFLGPTLGLLAEVAAGGEAVLDAAVHVHLPGLGTALGQDRLGPVAQLGREDEVVLGGGDGQRRPEARQLLLGHPRRVGHVAGLEVRVVARHILKVSMPVSTGESRPSCVRGVRAAASSRAHGGEGDRAHAPWHRSSNRGRPTA